jgi:ABC-2 type transport system ATP-binding protein
VTAVVTVDDLKIRYGSRTAVDHVSFAVSAGEIFALVGPNGAGKTSTIECVEGLRGRSGGSVRVLGIDPAGNRREVQRRIGCQLQESNLSDRLLVWEALDLFSSFYPRPIDWRVLTRLLGLDERRNAAYGTLSGGEKQRLFIALALVGNPDVIFLDELTSGLDPHGRRAMWDLVRRIRDHGKTVFLTTHFMDEAEYLCDRVAILDDGRLVALDTPANLVHSLGATDVVSFRVEGDFDHEPLSGQPDVVRVERSGDAVRVYGKDRGLASRVEAMLSARDVPLRDLRSQQTSLEDVFLMRTGRAMPADRSEGNGTRR